MVIWIGGFGSDSSYQGTKACTDDYEVRDSLIVILMLEEDQNSKLG